VGTVAYNSVDIFHHARSFMRNTFGGAMMCRYCKRQREAGIQDNIPACHACYVKKGGINE
jgi:aminoglycoside/choline kinase family phosphotransferase